jgi:[ribosomal protein S5]-alanine N-acetyltransferase
VKHDAILAESSVVLRAINPEHVTPEYVSWLNDTETVAHTEARFGKNDLQSTRDYVIRTLESPDALMWRICVEPRHVGNIRLSAINRRHRRAAVALMIGSHAHRGQGIGPTAIGLVSAYAFGTLALNKLTAGIYATNPASRRAFEKAGYTVEAVLRQHAFADDEFIDVWQMARFANH